MQLATRPELVTINVGGRLFTTTRATLTKHPDSMLCAMFRGDMREGLTDAQGNPFLDRDPTYFSTILAYLRDGAVPALPDSHVERQQLKAEARFFAMAELADAIESADAGDAQRAGQGQVLEVLRAERLAAACRAVEQAEARHKAAMEHEGYARLRRVREEMERWRRDEEAAEADGFHDRAVDARERRLQLDFDEALLMHMHDVDALEQEVEGARAQLRAAHLAVLCAMGADLAAAEAQLAATHPHLKPPETQP